MKKKVLSLIIAVALMLTLVPAPSQAQTPRTENFEGLFTISNVLRVENGLNPALPVHYGYSGAIESYLTFEARDHVRLHTDLFKTIYTAAPAVLTCIHADSCNPDTRLRSRENVSVWEQTAGMCPNGLRCCSDCRHITRKCITACNQVNSITLPEGVYSVMVHILDNDIWTAATFQDWTQDVSVK
jgi:hypothetical protein